MATNTPASNQPIKEISLDEFREVVRASRVTCKVCSYVSHSIVGHLRDEHQLSPGQYLKKFPGERVASKITVELMTMLGKTPVSPIGSQGGGFDLQTLLKTYQEGSAPIRDTLSDLRAKLPPKTWSPDELKHIPIENKNFSFTANARKIAFAMVTGKNAFMSGPTGCGKTEEFKQVAFKLGLPMRRANMHSDVTYGSLIGLMKANAQGTYFDYGLLPIAMKLGYPVLLDEIDFTPPHIASVLFPVLEQRSAELYIPETGETIRPVPGFAIMATGNTGGKGDLSGVHTGTEVQNTAFLDRFPIKLTADYLPAKEEVSVLMAQYPSARRSLVEKFVALATEVRVAFKAGDIALTLSTRKLQELVEFTEFMGVQEALAVTFTNWMDGDDGPFVGEIIKKLVLDKEK